MLFSASFEVEQRERDSNWIIFVTGLPTDSTRSRVAIELRGNPFITRERVFLAAPTPQVRDEQQPCARNPVEA